MSNKTTSLLFSLVVLTACSNVSTDSAAISKSETRTHEKSQSLEEVMENVLSYLRSGEIPPNCELTEPRSLDCEGEVLANPDAVPKDWVPFRFDGETYYFRPLSRGSSESELAAQSLSAPPAES